MSGVIEARQRLDSQLQENELVLKVGLSLFPFVLRKAFNFEKQSP